MNRDKQRIAIAEACGWRWCWCSGRVTSIPLTEGQPVTTVDNGPKRYMVAPDKDAGPLGHEGGMPDMRLDEDATSDVPDYLSDLNAMHEAENVLTVGQRIEYVREIGYIWTGRNDRAVPDWWLVHEATAAHRAEAFLRTIGKWEDES